MSTRAHLIIKKESEPTRYMYHHCDGYPEGVGEDLGTFFDESPKEFYDTPENFVKNLNVWDDQFEIEDGEDGSGENGEYVGLHGDEEYIYIIDYNNHIYSCYNVNRTPDGTRRSGWDIPEEEVTNTLLEFEKNF